MTVKTCTQCKIEKPLDAFHLGKRYKGGRRAQCRACMSAANKKWTEDNRDKVNARERKRYAREPQKFRVKGRKYRDDNRERIRKSRRAQRVAKPEIHKAYFADWWRREGREHQIAKRARIVSVGFLQTNIRGLHYVSAAEFDAIVAEQGGCAICQRVRIRDGASRMVIDHDHVTGLPRGVLCHICNTALHSFEADPSLLLAMERYILKTYGRRHQWDNTVILGPWHGKHPRRLKNTAQREAFDSWCEERGNSCEVCAKTAEQQGSTLDRDHCHVSGAYRGLLCSAHNHALGIFHQPRLITRAHAYLMRTSDPEHQQAFYHRLTAAYSRWKAEDREARRIMNRAA